MLNNTIIKCPRVDTADRQLLKNNAEIITKALDEGSNKR
jgi:hypothetical protein